MCGFFSYTFLVVIVCRTLVLALFFLAVELARMATENNNHPSNTIIRTRLLRVLSRLFLLSGSSQEKKKKKKEKRQCNKQLFLQYKKTRRKSRRRKIEEDDDDDNEDAELRIDKRENRSLLSSLKELIVIFTILASNLVTQFLFFMSPEKTSKNEEKVDGDYDQMSSISFRERISSGTYSNKQRYH